MADKTAGKPETALHVNKPVRRFLSQELVEITIFTIVYRFESFLSAYRA